MIFGDGGGAILQPTKKGYGIIDSILHMDGNGGDYLIVPAGGSRIPASVDSVNGRNILLNKMEKQSSSMLLGDGGCIKKNIMKNNLSGDDISLFIPHQANKRIIDVSSKMWYSRR